MNEGSNILDILTKLNSGKFENLTQKELLVVTFYEQTKIREEITKLHNEISLIKVPQLEGMEERLNDLEGWADEEEGKRKAWNTAFIIISLITAFIAAFSAIMSIPAT